MEITKSCSKCKKNKALDDFYVSGIRNTVNTQCKGCVKERVSKYYSKNKEKIIRYVSQYQKDNHERVSKRKDEWYRKDKEKNPEKYKERARLDNIFNKERRRMACRRWNARRKVNGGSHRQEDWLMILDRFGNQCLACGSKEKIEKDHIKPVSIGGDNGKGNLQPLCRSCNARKHAKEINYIAKIIYREDLLRDSMRINYNYI